VVEVVWNEGLNFGTEGEKLDSFSTFGGLGISGDFGAGRRGFGRGRLPGSGKRTRPNRGGRLRAGFFTARPRSCPDTDLIGAIPRREGVMPRSPNPWLFRSAPRSRTPCLCLDNAFPFIDRVTLLTPLAQARLRASQPVQGAICQVLSGAPGVPLLVSVAPFMSQM
jgi:hypothetical protein